MIFARDRFTQLRFFYRAYYSPEHDKMYPDRCALCPKCTSVTGSFFHVICSCQRLQLIWKGVVADCNSIGKLQVPYDPLLLGIYTLEATQAKKTVCILHSLLRENGPPKMEHSSGCIPHPSSLTTSDTGPNRISSTSTDLPAYGGSNPHTLLCLPCNILNCYT